MKVIFSDNGSRRITEEQRLVYSVENNELLIAQCRFHY
nr:type II toxin-antitoxin system YoeB family toxin [Photorhabdus luminescens]